MSWQGHSQDYGYRPRIWPGRTLLPPPPSRKKTAKVSKLGSQQRKFDVKEIPKITVIPRSSRLRKVASWEANNSDNLPKDPDDRAMWRERSNKKRAGWIRNHDRRSGGKGNLERVAGVRALPTASSLQEPMSSCFRAGLLPGSVLLNFSCAAWKVFFARITLVVFRPQRFPPICRLLRAP